MLIIRLILGYVIAYLSGKLMNKIKLPQILGWLLAGVIFGPNIIGLVSRDVMALKVFPIIMNLAKSIVGIMVGYGMVFNNIKKAGVKYLTITLSEIITTMVFTGVIFAIIFAILGIPWQLAILCGLVSVPTAPGVNLSLISEFKAKGKFTETLRTVTGLNSIFSNLFFYTLLGVVQVTIMNTSEVNISIVDMMVLPLIIGAIFGVITSKAICIFKDTSKDLLVFVSFIIITCSVALYVDNYIIKDPVMNFVILGIGFSTAYVNMVKKEKFISIRKCFNPIQQKGLMCLVFGLGLPLNPKLIPEHLFILLAYIIVRGIGKIGGTYFGASLAKEEESIKRNIKYMMLPAAGVSLVFFSNAAAIVEASFPDFLYIFTVAFPAGVMINDIVGIMLGKKAFVRSGEIDK
ncbi:MAG: cation:proton antiporter [Anaerococcus sp.]|nr:cation:proton antiporter [Anaerococcus sp.]